MDIFSYKWLIHKSTIYIFVQMLYLFIYSFIFVLVVGYNYENVVLPNPIY